MLSRLVIILLAAVAIVWQTLWPVVALLLVGIPSAIATAWCFRRMNAAASRTLGIPINWQSGPPRRADAYEKWCSTAGLVPYNAPNRFVRAAPSGLEGIGCPCGTSAWSATPITPG